MGGSAHTMSNGEGEGARTRAHTHTHHVQHLSEASGLVEFPGSSTVEAVEEV